MLEAVETLIQNWCLFSSGADQEHDDDDFKWDSDDEDTTYRTPATDTSGKGKQKASPHNDDTTNDTNKSDTDYSNISEPPSTEASLVSPPLKSQADADEWVRTSAEDRRGQQPLHADAASDSDSDWE